VSRTTRHGKTDKAQDKRQNSGPGKGRDWTRDRIGQKDRTGQRDRTGQKDRTGQRDRTGQGQNRGRGKGQRDATRDTKSDKMKANEGDAYWSARFPLLTSDFFVKFQTLTNSMEARRFKCCRMKQTDSFCGRRSSTVATAARLHP